MLNAWTTIRCQYDFEELKRELKNEDESASFSSFVPNFYPCQIFATSQKNKKEEGNIIRFKIRPASESFYEVSIKPIETLFQDCKWRLSFKNYPSKEDLEESIFQNLDNMPQSTADMYIDEMGLPKDWDFTKIQRKSPYVSSTISDTTHIQIEERKVLRN